MILLFAMSAFHFLSKSRLFVATRTDAASMNIVNHLLQKFEWTPIIAKEETTEEGQEIYQISQLVNEKEETVKSLYLWIVNQSMLRLDEPDQLFKNVLKSNPNTETKSVDISDVVFLSKHSASSGTISLTVHPIGIPWLVDNLRSGGYPKRCSPPSPHIAPLYRSILRATRCKGIESKFQVTMEATHHGPFCSLPCCFVEIGSSESEWSDDQAGDIWADCLGEYFRLPIKANSPRLKAVAVEENELGQLALSEAAEKEEFSCFEDPREGVAILIIGGGHYVPKMNDLVRMGSKYHVGHALASYTLLQEDLSDEKGTSTSKPSWREIIHESIESTQIAYPGIRVVCLIDKKAFLAEQRNQIVSIVEDKGIAWTYKTGDIKKFGEISTGNIPEKL